MNEKNHMKKKGIGHKINPKIKIIMFRLLKKLRVNKFNVLSVLKKGFTRLRILKRKL